MCTRTYKQLMCNYSDVSRTFFCGDDLTLYVPKDILPRVRSEAHPSYLFTVTCVMVTHWLCISYVLVTHWLRIGYTLVMY